MEFLEGETVQSIIKWAAIILFIATAIAAVTPSNKDDGWVNAVGRFFDKLGIDVKGIVKGLINKDDPPK